MTTTRPRPFTGVAIAVALAAALTPFGEVFDGTAWLLPILGAVAAGVGITALVLRQTNGSRPAVVGSTVVGSVVWVMLTVPDAASSPISALRDGIFDGWSQLFSEELPLVEDQSALVLLAVLAWIAAAVSVDLVARHASAIGVLVAVPALLTLAIAAALPAGAVASVVGAGTGAALLLVVAVVGRAEGEGWGLYRVATLFALLLVATGFAVLLGPLAETVRDEPADPRDNRATQVTSIELPNLLQRFSAEIDQPEAPPVMEVASLDGSELPRLRLRVQAYDVYDGQRWVPTADYVSVDAVPEPDILPPGDAVTVRVTPDGLAAPWVPVPDRVVTLETDDLRWSEATQTALATELGTYVVAGSVVDRSGLEGTPTARDSVDERFLEIPADTPDSIRALAATVSAGAEDDLAEIEAITDYVFQLGRDESGPPGHSLGRLSTIAASDEATGAEQLAALHALMVRSQGHPARVVVGYLVDGPTVEVTDLHAWVEVGFEGRGWVATEPSPVYADANGAVGDDDPTPPSTTLPTDDIVEAQSLPRELNPDERPEEDEPAGGGVSGVLVGSIAAAVVVLGTLLALVLARVSRRRGRRRARTPDARALGAWAELIDRLRENGQRPRSSTTIDDAIELAGDIDPAVAEASRPLAAIAAEALHAPEAPDAQMADAAWAHLAEAEGALVAARGHGVTARRLTDPRVLRHRPPVPPPR